MASLTPAEKTRVTAVLAVAVMAIASSSVLVRSMEAQAAAITVWRCSIAALILAPSLRSMPALSLRDAGWIAVSGTFLGLHFTTWFASLASTTVLRSTVLVAMVPAWTGLLEWAIDGVRPRWPFWLGIGIALGGVVLFASGEGEGSLYGDALAGVAGAFWAIYFMVGRNVRQRVEIFPYMALVSGVAALTVLPFAVWTEVALTGFPTATWVLLGVAAIGPQLLGHQGLGYAVKYVTASTVATVMLLEPVGASILALLVLGEWPPPEAALGALLVLLGVGIALRDAAK